LANFVRLAQTAERLIRKNGRPVKLLRLSETPLDPDKPWRGTDCAEDEFDAIAAVVESESEGVLERRGDFEAWLFPIPGQDLNTVNFLVDGDKRMAVQLVEEIKPALVPVAYRMVLQR
jgi:hypothetical protein